VIEYAIILVVVALVVSAMVTLIGKNTSANLCEVSSALGGTGTIYADSSAGGTNGLGSITEYSASATGNATPTVTISGSNTGLNYPAQTMAIDSSGNLYVPNKNGGQGSITVYACGASGNVTPIRTIAGNATTTINTPTSVALDSAGNLYVNNKNGGGAGTVTKYLASQLTGSGSISPAPAMTISTDFGPLNLQIPSGIFVTSSGNIWVVEAGFAPGNDGAEEFPSTGTLLNTISGANTNMDTAGASPNGIAIGSNGTIYVGNWNDYIEEWPSSVLTGNGSNLNVAPSVTVTVSTGGGSFFEDIDLAFDSSGNLYTPMYNNGGAGQVQEYSAAQITATGSPTPVNTISGAATGLIGSYGVLVH